MTSPTRTTGEELDLYALAQSGQAVAARTRRRAVAAVVDTLLGVILLTIPAAALAGTAETRDGVISGSLSGRTLLVWIGLMCGYYFLAEGTWGSTLGKSVVRLRVVDLRGSSVSWKRAFVRNVVRPVDAIGFYLVGIIFMSIFDTLEQRLGDRLAGTVVVSRKNFVAPP